MLVCLHMIKVLDPKGCQGYHHFRMFFDLNNDPYEWVDDPEHTDQVDVLVLNHVRDNKYNCRLPLFLDIKHNFDDQVKLLDQRSKATPNRYTVTNAVDFDIDNPNILFNDFLFNRTKAYYLGYNFSPLTRKWYYTNPKDYIIPEHSVEKKKIFVAPNRTQPQTPFRNQLVEFLSKSVDIGYTNLVSAIETRSDITLEEIETKRSIQKLGYSPPHNLYYQNTFISIVGETNEFGTSFAATEKTFDPLIKGHFVLPYSNHNFIKNLKLQYDFKFPDFIDYSYDEQVDNNQRFKYYSDEVKRLLSLSLDTWNQHWLDYQEIRQHNQNIFRNRPYHKVDLIRLLQV
jgi:hypothetical protein